MDFMQLSLKSTYWLTLLIFRLKTALEAAHRRANDLEAESRNRKAVISNLESELSGYEAMGVDELSESMVALGLAGTSKADGKKFELATLLYNLCTYVGTLF